MYLRCAVLYKGIDRRSSSEPCGLQVGGPPWIGPWLVPVCQLKLGSGEFGGLVHSLSSLSLHMSRHSTVLYVVWQGASLCGECCCQEGGLSVCAAGTGARSEGQEPLCWSTEWMESLTPVHRPWLIRHVSAIIQNIFWGRSFIFSTLVYIAELESRLRFLEVLNIWICHQVAFFVEQLTFSINIFPLISVNIWRWSESYMRPPSQHFLSESAHFSHLL